MTRYKYTLDTVRALFAKSGNQCAFPGCTAPLINENNMFIGMICHIESAEPNGPRYNLDSTDDDRRMYDNLLLLCYAHHKVVDKDTTTYTVSKLKELKALHESQFIKNIYVIDGTALHRIATQMSQYWDKIDRIQYLNKDEPLLFKVDTKADFLSVLESLLTSLNKLSEILNHLRKSDDQLEYEAEEFLMKIGYDIQTLKDIPYYENIFMNRNWEFHNIGINNTFLEIRMYLFQIEIQYLTEYLKTNPTDLLAQKKFDEKKKKFENYIKNSYYYD